MDWEVAAEDKEIVLSPDELLRILCRISRRDRIIIEQSQELMKLTDDNRRHSEKTVDMVCVCQEYGLQRIPYSRKTWWQWIKEAVCDKGMTDMK